MRYLFLLWGDEAAELALSADERLAIVNEHGAFARRVRDRGREAAGEALGSARDAILVRRRDGSAVDGPFRETKEQIGGFYVIDCRDRDEAVAIARDIPASPGLTVEIRALPD
jgi:hypothetical protein